ncbi:MAG: tandem-95 repeat protein [Acidimicrobiia bacterium]|nr:tandem-95 repeat protein [Acidimicrobiia bacterium]
MAAFVLPLVFAVLVAWQLTRILPTPRTWPGMIFWWLLVMASSTMALRFADRFAKRLMPLAVLMKLSLVFPDKAPNRFGVSLKSGTAHSLEELLERAERAGRHDDLTEAAETILALGAALNAHDPRTRGHGDRVRAYADMLGEEMGYTDEERNKLKWAAMLHDIGKLRVPSEIINSPGKLTDEEWTIMRNHPDWGMELATPLLPWLGEFAAAIGQHHERFDGNGYPNGIAGEDIGLAARITSVADTYDVMTSVRSYKEARPASEAREELARCAGSQFDPVVVRAFLNISLGRQRWVAGPLSWLAQVPFFQSALQGATTLAQNAAVTAQTGLAATAIGATAVVAPAIIETPTLAPETALPAIVVEANDDALELPEDGSDAIFVLGNDDVEVSSLTIVAGPSHGTATLSPGGTLTYIPDPNFSGTDTLTYEVCGPDGSCDTAVLSISVAEVNDPPDLLAVPASLDEDTSTVVDVLSSVVDIDGDPAAAAITLIGVADEGLVLSNGDGTFTYTPPPDFNGTDSFTVQICDEGGACELRALSITVGALNDEPTVDVVVPPITEDTPASIFVDAADVDGDLLTTSVVAGPISGTAVVDIDGSIAYSPGADFAGAESITLEVCDPTTCVSEVVSFTVAAVNDPPIVPGPGPLTTAEETMISFDPLAGASDPEGGALALGSFDTVSANGGTIALGSLEYTPALDFVGVDTFSYSVADPDGGTASVTVTITVTGVNDDPTAVADGYTGAEDTPLVVAAPGLLSNDSDVDGDALTAMLGTSPPVGSVSVAGDGSFTYTPAPDFFGTDSFTYLADDGAGGSAAGTVTIEVSPVNDAPVAFDDIASTSGPGAVVVSVLANDVDVEGNLDPASVSVVVPPGKGLAVANPDGTIAYTPDSGETGSDSFAYEVCDLSALCDVATVTMGIMGPDAVDDTAGVVEDGSVIIPATDNDTDPDGDLDPSSAVVHISPVSGTATANGDGSFDYTPDPDFFGVDSFEYKVCDLAAACDAATVTITVTAVNDAPVANDDSVGVTEDFAPGVTFDVLANDTDVDLDTLSLDSFDGSTIANGSLVDNGGGSFTYVPDPEFFGVESFAYDITDGALTDTGTVTITVANVPDAPDTQDDGYSTDRDTDIVEPAPGVLANDTDYDGDTLTAALAGPPANGGVVLNPDGSFTYTPDPGYVGPDSFTYTADDGLNPPVPATVNIVVDDGIVPTGWYLGDTGPAPDTYLFVGSPPPLGNPDPDGDGNPGITILDSGGDEGETDPLYYQQWLLAAGGSAVELNGPVTLKLWSTSEFFQLGKATDLTVWIHDCDAAGTICGPALLNFDVHYGDWNLGVADFTYREVPIGSLDHTVAAGRTLRFRLQFDHAPVWVGMNSDYPTEVVFTSANRAPATGPDALSLLEDAATVNLDVLANDVDPNLDPASLSIDTAPASGTAVVVAGPTIDYTPAPDYFGPDGFVYEVCDTSGACSAQTVAVTLTPVNDAPSFTVGPDQTVLEDAGGQTVDPHPTAISPGPANESGQSTGFTVTNDNAALFKTAPTLSDSGRLQYEAWDDVSGSATVTVSITDDGGTADGGVDTSADQTFTITVTGVNDQPDFDDGPDVDVNEDSGPQTFAGWATAITAGAPEEESPVQTLTFQIAANDNVPLFAVAPSVDPTTGDLTFTPAADVSGTANIQLRVADDGGTANGGVDTSGVQPFKITVDPVNDAPSFTKGPDQDVEPDSGAHSIVGWATAISPGPADESGQAVSFNTTGNTNPGLFSAPPLVSSAGTLNYTVAPGQVGTATITIEAQDDGGTANAGVDRSPGQTFDIVVSLPKVLISEFRLNGPGGAGDEYIEIFNAHSAPVALDGWKLHVTSGIDADFFTFPSFTLNPGQHYLVANSGAPVGLGADGTWAGLDYGSAFGDVQLLTGSGTQIDALAYGVGPVLGEGTALPAWVNPSTLDSSWERLYLDPFGNCVDTDDNAADFVFRYGHANPQNSLAGITPCVTPATPASIVISEVSRRSALDARDEFIELFNPTAAPIDVSGWTVGVDFPFSPIIPGGTIIPPGGHYLLAGELYSGAAIPDFQVPALGINWIVGTDIVWVRDNLNNLIDIVAINQPGGEGDPLPTLAGGAFDNYTYERVLGGCYDTNDNAHDFAPNPAPGDPQSLSSPPTPCV